MNRRQFIATLFGAAAGAVVVAKAETAFGSSFLETDLRYPKPYDKGFNGFILKEAVRLFEEHRAIYGAPRKLRQLDRIDWLEGAKIGYRSEGITLHQQLNVGTRVHLLDGLMPYDVDAMMQVLAAGSIEEDFGVCAKLPIPRAITYGGWASPLRILMDYDVLRDGYLLRFDVLGGATEESRALGRKFRQDSLKKQIALRLEANRGLVMRLPE